MELSVTLKETENGDVVLIRNNKPLVCPVATRLLTPGNMSGSLSLNQSICGSHCALFRTDDMYENGRIDVYLCNSQFYYDILKSTEKQDKSPLIL